MLNCNGLFTVDKIDLSENHGNAGERLKFTAGRLFFSQSHHFINQVGNHTGMGVAAIHADMGEVAVTDHRQNQFVVHICNVLQHDGTDGQGIGIAWIFFTAVDAVDLIFIDNADISLL